MQVADLLLKRPLLARMILSSKYSLMTSHLCISFSILISQSFKKSAVPCSSCCSSIQASPVLLSLRAMRLQSFVGDLVPVRDGGAFLGRLRPTSRCALRIPFSPPRVWHPRFISSITLSPTLTPHVSSFSTISTPFGLLSNLLPPPACVLVTAACHLTNCDSVMMT